ncbi:32572_t:CDS:2 [Gigaspora margarita]|uniref:32572_t:CDS:1 n=1 Tax=Gigaspora margarita TaxID=4874 RepID=A0ABM8VVS4_GIGMA|nr:32572_t:CDS:2 [Gigaspora margarita]
MNNRPNILAPKQENKGLSYDELIGKEIKCLDLQFQYKRKWRNLDGTEVIDFQIHKNLLFDLVLEQDWLWMHKAKISFGFSSETCSHYAKIVIDSMSIPLIDRDFNKASSTKNNLSNSMENKIANESTSHNTKINTTIAKEIIKIRTEINNNLTAKIKFCDANYATEVQNIITIINDVYEKYNKIKQKQLQNNKEKSNYIVLQSKNTSTTKLDNIKEIKQVSILISQGQYSINTNDSDNTPKKIVSQNDNTPASDNSDLSPDISSEIKIKMKTPKIDIQLLMQELFLELSEEDCIRLVNVKETRSKNSRKIKRKVLLSSVISDQSPLLTMSATKDNNDPVTNTTRQLNDSETNDAAQLNTSLELKPKENVKVMETDEQNVEGEVVLLECSTNKQILCRGANTIQINKKHEIEHKTDMDINNASGEKIDNKKEEISQIRQPIMQRAYSEVVIGNRQRPLYKGGVPSLLYRYFDYEEIPSHLIIAKELPSPEWNIFDLQNKPSTHQIDHEKGNISMDRSTIDDDEQMQY